MIATVPDLRGKTVLIVEDDSFSMKILQYLVGKTGASCLSAMDGEAAIQIFMKTIPDMVLLDIRLPKKDGYEVLKFIRDRDTNVPVIAETAHAQREEIQRFSYLGFSDYMLKPIEHDTLYRMLEKFL
jgi:CheY-like chemotaxis protein